MIKIDKKILKEKLKKDIVKGKNKQREPYKLREFILTCRVSNSPNKNYALDYYKESIL